MAYQDVTISSASGETDFLNCNSEGYAWVGVTGNISAGAILIVVKANGGSTEFVADTIDATALQVNANEAGTGYSYFEKIQIPYQSSVALKANAAFTGSVVVSVIAGRF